MLILDIGAFAVGVIIGFLGGLFGKGGSAVATPLLSLVGFPGFIAVASPLPATVPGTLIASLEYRSANLVDWNIVFWSVALGVPSSIIGSFLTTYTGSYILLVVTGLIVLAFGFSLLLAPREKRPSNRADTEVAARTKSWRTRLFLVAIGVGLVSGLLANSGGFLLAPAYARILDQPLKKAFASSLAVSVFLALPGTTVHAYLGHISWSTTAFIALGSVPSSYIGARVAIRTAAERLERWYGLALTALGVLFLFRL